MPSESIIHNESSLRRAWPLRVADRTAFFDKVASGNELVWTNLRSILLVAGCSCVYGWTFGFWRSDLLALYVAIKLPILLLSATGLVMLLNWMFGQLMGSGLRLVQVASLTYRAMAIACLLLLSFAPITTFLAVSCPPPSTEDNIPHNVLLLCHVFLVGSAAFFGNATMMQGLRQICRPGCPVVRLYLVWIGTNVFVGCQLSWILRPFLGSPHYPVVFLRPDALEGNFFEFVFVKVIPNVLLGGG